MSGKQSKRTPMELPVQGLPQAQSPEKHQAPSNLPDFPGYHLCNDGEVTSRSVYNAEVTRPIDITPDRPVRFQRQGSFVSADTILEIVDCSYVVRVKGAADVRGSLLPFQRSLVSKVLVDGFNAHVASGQVLALLGPSGAGKTTLLSMLTFQKGSGKAYGRVTLNGQPFTPTLFKQHASLVEQHDQLWPFLTAREHVNFAADMFLSSCTAGERKAMADELLGRMGVAHVQDTLAGIPPLIKGLSGGEKRRLSLAVALAKRSSLIFLDEPTSGLDAAAAASVMGFLQNTAMNLNLALLCTIHQPSSEVFARFANDDKLPKEVATAAREQLVQLFAEKAITEQCTEPLVVQRKFPKYHLGTSAKGVKDGGAKLKQALAIAGKWIAAKAMKVQGLLPKLDEAPCWAQHWHHCASCMAM